MTRLTSSGRSEEAPAPDLRAAAVELVERTTAAQGLPGRVSDPATLDRVARLMAPDRANTT